MRYFLLLLIPVCLFGAAEEEAVAKRIYSHLLINDTYTAIDEARVSLERYPESKPLQVAYFRALCQQGDELETLRAWEKIPAPEKNERSILEALGWGVLNKGRQSSQLEIRLNVLMAAAYTHDVKALPRLLEELNSSNAILRALAIHLSASYGDAPLRQELERLLKEEKVWFVRLEVINAIGRLGIKKLQNQLKEILAHPKTSLEEKASAQIALISIYDTISKKELTSLIKSNRSSLRHLACEILAHLELSDEIEEIYPLLKDTSSEVRIAALNALTFLKAEKAVPHIKELLEDSSFEVAITAAWSMMSFDPKLGEEKFKIWLRDPDSEHRRMAAGALSITGPAGVPLSLKVMKESSDYYVKATLAIGLIGQRKNVSLAQETIYNLLVDEPQTLWMWESRHNALFRSLAPSRLRHREGVPNYPKVMDQMVRLELLSLLCMTKYPKAEGAVRDFLKSQSWGITGAAASVLLGEGNETSLEISRSLLKDPDEKIRMQAAFILAVMGNDENALPVLQEAYPRLDRMMKLHVLEAVAHVGDPSSIPFLINQLKEPYQVLRVAAASALIQCLYH